MEVQESPAPDDGEPPPEPYGAAESSAARCVRTLDRKAAAGEMIKPGELIDIRGIEKLTLKDRQNWNLLLENAFGPDMAVEDQDFEIAISELRGSHKHNERTSDSIRRLMTTIATTVTPEGKRAQFQLLGGNNMDKDDRENGVLTYRFDRDLIAVVRDSFTFGKLEMAVMRSFTSKYALALWEYGSKRVRLRYKTAERMPIEEFRAVLGVEHGKLEAWSDLRKRAVAPALEEINALATFTMRVTPIKTVRRVTHVEVAWKAKSQAERAAALQELGRSRVGRKARIRDRVDAVVAEAA